MSAQTGVLVEEGSATRLKDALAGAMGVFVLVALFIVLP